MHPVIHRSLIAISIALLSSCGGDTNVKPNTQTPIVKHDTVDAKNTPVVATTMAPSAKELVALAQQKLSPDREKLLLQAADLYIDQNRSDKARNILNELNTNAATDDFFTSYSQTSAKLSLKDGEVDVAKHILTNPRLEQHLNKMEPAQEAAVRELRAQAFERSGLLEDSIAERINVSPLLTNAEKTNANQDALWQTLMLLPLPDLTLYATNGKGDIAQGWYSLAALSKNNTQDLEAQQSALNAWLTQWRSHPASTNLPKDLRSLQTLISQQPRKIALLLPLQGRLAEAGEAVRDGFFAAYYQTNGNRQRPSVRQYDTSKNVTAAYQQAITDGADLIIGPLDKEDTNQLSRLGSYAVPLLTLNYPDQQPAQAVDNFYQFGLAVEDEARQVARQAIQDGHRRALIVAPAADWSERSAQAFINEWQKLGGSILGKSTFTDQDHFSEHFRNLMLIDESHSRMILLQQQLGTKFEFIPRRRADVDMIFMAVSPAQGRQIKPTLAFHFANNIACYATSAIYSGEQDAVNNEDLDGILFNTLPWVFDKNPEKQAIAQNTKSSAVYGRLHALGADAFHLYARIPQLKQSPQMRIYGSTGSLHLLADGRIEREQLWAHFNAGLAEPLPVVVDNTPDENGE